MTPNLISHYRIIRSLGAGGMGEVFLAQDTKLDRQVAIKCLASRAVGNEQAAKRLIREAKAAASLDHPNICTVHEVGEDGDRAFIVMQFVEGNTLSWRLRNEPPTVYEAVDIASQVAEALIEAHSRGVVHRDIKPQNLIITPRGQVKVLDFGLAKWVPERAGIDTQKDTLTLLTDPGMVIGTVPYMSPEQIKGGHVDARSDLFALGALLYESVTGKPAFTGSNSMDVCAQVIHVNPRLPSELNPQVSPELESIIVKALAKDTAARYQSASEMLADLRKSADIIGNSDQLRSAQSTQRRRHALRAGFAPGWLGVVRRNTTIAAASGIGLIVLVVATWLAVTNRNTGPHQPAPLAKKHYDDGINMLRNGAYYQASKLLQSAVALDDKFALAHARLAEAYAELDDTVKAKDELLVAQSLAPDRSALSQVDAGYLKAISAVATRDFDGAIETYRGMVEQSADAEKSSLLLDLGRSYEKSENTEKAIQTYRQVIERDPQSAAGLTRLGILYGREQDLKRAKESFDKAEEIYQRSSNTEGQYEVLYQRGTLLNNIGNLGEAREPLEKALRMSRDAKNAYQQIKALLQLSYLSWNEGNTVKAREDATEAIELAQRNDIRRLAINGLIDLGYAFMSRGELDESGKSLKQALEFAQTDKAQLGEARALLALGNLNLQLDNPDEAMRCLTQAHDFYKGAGYRKQASTCRILLARANRQKGEYDAAVKISEEQLQIASELGLSSLVAAAHSNIGYVLGIELERYPEGLKHVDDALGISESLGDTFGVGYELMNRGRLLWHLGRYAEARTILDRAFSIADHPEASYKELLAYVCLSRAQMSLSEMRFVESKKQSQKALDVAPPRYKDVTIQAKCTLGVAQVLSGELREGKALCELAVRNARETKNARLIATSLLSLAEVLLKTNDAKEALANALEARQSFERFGQNEGEWRASLIAARASHSLLDNESARNHANNAADILSSLQSKWGAEPYAIYLTRPDVRICGRQIEQIRGATSH